MSQKKLRSATLGTRCLCLPRQKAQSWALPPGAGLMRAGCWMELAPGPESGGAPACPAQPECSVGLGLCSLPCLGAGGRDCSNLHLPPCFLVVASLMMASKVPDVTTPLKIERGGEGTWGVGRETKIFPFFYQVLRKLIRTNNHHVV